MSSIAKWMIVIASIFGLVSVLFLYPVSPGTGPLGWVRDFLIIEPVSEV